MEHRATQPVVSNRLQCAGLTQSIWYRGVRGGEGEGSNQTGSQPSAQRATPVSAPRLLHPTWVEACFSAQKRARDGVNCYQLLINPASQLHLRSQAQASAKQYSYLCSATAVPHLSNMRIALSIPDETLRQVHPTTPPSGYSLPIHGVGQRRCGAKNSCTLTQFRPQGPQVARVGAQPVVSPPPFGHTLLGDRPGTPRSLRDPQGS